jgi:hypothetical protein
VRDTLAETETRGTLARLRGLRGDLIDPTIALHHRRVVRTPVRANGQAQVPAASHKRHQRRRYVGSRWRWRASGAGSCFSGVRSGIRPSPRRAAQLTRPLEVFQRSPLGHQTMWTRGAISTPWRPSFSRSGGAAWSVLPCGSFPPGSRGTLRASQRGYDPSPQGSNRVQRPSTVA